MTTFYLVRHGEKDADPDLLVGRGKGIHLTERGRRQAERMGEKLSGLRLQGIWSSPLERARETAEPLSRLTGLPVHIADGLTELDFGEWTGRRCSELKDDPRWRLFNTFRSATPIPGGEWITEVQRRFVAEMLRIREQVPDGAVVLVSHGDPIKTAVGYFLTLPLDAWPRFDIAVASVSVIALDTDSACVARINDELDDRD